MFDLCDICCSASGSWDIASWSLTRRIAAGIADVLPVSLLHGVGEPLLRFLAAPVARRKQVLVVALLARVSELACALQVGRGEVAQRQPLLTEFALQLGAIVLLHFLRQDF